jgi:hypothetical protein
VNTLKPGDRVRLTSRNRHPLYRAGDKGVVLRGQHDLYFDSCDFYVTMDKARLPGTFVIFTEGEIELDE